MGPQRRARHRKVEPYFGSEAPRSLLPCKAEYAPALLLRLAHPPLALSGAAGCALEPHAAVPGCCNEAPGLPRSWLSLSTALQSPVASSPCKDQQSHRLLGLILKRPQPFNHSDGKPNTLTLSLSLSAGISNLLAAGKSGFEPYPPNLFPFFLLNSCSGIFCLCTPIVAQPKVERFFPPPFSLP